MKVAYIVGPYRSKTIRGIVENIRTAERYALKYWKSGYAVICPHKNTALLDGATEDEVWLEGDKELLKRSDLIVVTPNWEKSKGSVQEIRYAKKLGKEIIFEKKKKKP